MEKNIQSVINSIASDNDLGEDLQPVPQVGEDDLNGDPKPGEGSPQGDGQGANPGTGSNDETKEKDNQAFAAMRIANKEMQAKLDQALAEIEALKKNEVIKPGEPEVKPEPNPLDIKDTDSEEVKALKKELADVKSLTTELQEDRNKRATEEQKMQIASQLNNLKTKYTLNTEQLLQFADDAEKQGFILGQTNLSVDQLYTLVYHDQIVQNAIKSVETKTNEDLAPGTGPGNGNPGSAGTESLSVRDMTRAIIKDLKLE